MIFQLSLEEVLSRTKLDQCQNIPFRFQIKEKRKTITQDLNGDQRTIHDLRCIKGVIILNFCTNKSPQALVKLRSVEEKLIYKVGKALG